MEIRVAILTSSCEILNTKGTSCQYKGCNTFWYMSYVPSWHKAFLGGSIRRVEVQTILTSTKIFRVIIPAPPRSWLAKGLGLGLLCLGFKGVQEEIPSEETSTLQIGSVAFPPGQCTSPPLHLCHRLFDQDGHKTVSHPPYSPDLAPCDFFLFPKLTGCRYETIEMKETVTKVIDMLAQEDFHGAFQKLLERHNKCIAAGGDYFEGD